MTRLKPASITRAMLASALALLSVNAAPAFADTASGESRVAIVTPLSFFITDQMSFGTIFSGTTPSTVVLAPNGTRTVTAGNAVLAGNSEQAAVFAGQGSFNQRIDISVGSNTINLTGPGAPMQVDTWVVGTNPTVQLTTSPLRFRIRGASGVYQFPLGATLQVGANQAPGVYTGNFTINLEYQ
jgi:hypothetical protein